MPTTRDGQGILHSIVLRTIDRVSDALDLCRQFGSRSYRSIEAHWSQQTPLSFLDEPEDLQSGMLSTKWRKLGTLALALSQSGAQTVFDLQSVANWTLSNTNGSILVPARIPSQSHLDLQAAKLIPDPLYGFNDDALSWVINENWTYTSGSLNNIRPGDFQSTWLVFEGLDTYATVRLCDQVVGNTSNQFLQYSFDVSTIANECDGDLRLSLEFGSTPEVQLAISKDDDGVNFVNGCNDANPNGCRIWTRKETNDFGWDWAPSLIPVGPWRGIRAVKTNLQQPIHVNNALIDVYRQGQLNNLPPDQSKPWIFNTSLDFVGDMPPGSRVHLTLVDANGRQIVDEDLNVQAKSEQTITASTTIDPADVRLWWPNGMGDQPLYSAEITVYGYFLVPIASVKRRIGFRTIVLNLEPVSAQQIARGIAPGSNWHFEINGKEMYVKGSNFVPPDPFWPRVNETKIRRLFEASKVANFNMLRVWSSGVYLDDYIYDVADEMGLLLWSEMQFTDAPYPDTDEYLAKYEAEAYYNVRRVNHHPSLALWAGGNELENVLLQFYFDADNPSDLQLKYEKIQLEVLIKCVYANTRSISYIPSSTYHGYLSLDFDSITPQTPRYLNRSGPDDIYQNTDYYDTNPFIAFNFSVYPVGRLATEFGVISMPSLQSWRNAAPPEDFYMESPTVVHHNRHIPFGTSGSPEDQRRKGIDEMTDAVNVWYPPPDLSDMTANFTAWIYSTQVFQASYVQNQIAFYRRGSGLRERQLGSLFWMLEDIWVGPTWACIESSGRQKILYYTTKDIFQPVVTYAFYEADSTALEVYVTSDLPDQVSGTLTYQWLDWSGNPLAMGINQANPSRLRNPTTTTSSRTFSNMPSVLPTRLSYLPPLMPPSRPPPMAVANAASTTNQTQSIGAKRFSVGPLNSTLVLRYPKLQHTLETKGYELEDAVLRISLTSDDDNHKHSYFFHPTAIDASMLKDPGLKLEKVGGSWRVTATSALAAWVWLDYQTNAVTGYWSENGFWLRRGESKTVTFTVWEDWSGGAWTKTVTVRSLWDNTESRARNGTYS